MCIRDRLKVSLFVDVMNKPLLSAFCFSTNKTNFKLIQGKNYEQDCYDVNTKFLSILRRDMVSDSERHSKPLGHLIIERYKYLESKIRCASNPSCYIVNVVCVVILTKTRSLYKRGNLVSESEIFILFVNLSLSNVTNM